MEITASKAFELINEICKQPGNLFEMIRTDVKQFVSRHMSELINVELTEFLGRQRYQQIAGQCNHLNLHARAAMRAKGYPFKRRLHLGEES